MQHKRNSLRLLVRFTGCLLVAAMLSACAAGKVRDCASAETCSAPEQEFQQILKQHALFVDRRGYAVGLDVWLGGWFDTNTWYDAKRDEAAENAYIKTIIDGAQKALAAGCPTESKNLRPELVIFIHGGLRTNSNTYRLNQHLLTQTDLKDDCRYPILVNWRSGAVSTYKDHAVRLRQGRDGGFPALASSPIYVGTDVAQAIVGTPKAWLTQGTHSLRSTVFSDYASYDNVPTCNGNSTLTCKAEFKASCEQHGLRIKPWQRSSLWLATLPFRVVSTPVIHTAGKPAWDVMLHRTNTLLYKACELNGTCPDARSDNEDFLGNGALAKLLRQIRTLISEDGHKKLDIEVTLIGHSMGAIPINRIAASMPDLPLDNIVFLGAADSVRNTHTGALHYLSHSENTRFFSWMLHPDNEARELELAGLVPSGTLLNWIDNMYTTPESPLDYRIGRYDSVRLFPELVSPAIEDRVHLIVFPQNGDDVPLKHGDFDDCRFWDSGPFNNS